MQFKQSFTSPTLQRSACEGGASSARTVFGSLVAGQNTGGFFPQEPFLDMPLRLGKDQHATGGTGFGDALRDWQRAGYNGRASPAGAISGDLGPARIQGLFLPSILNIFPIQLVILHELHALVLNKPASLHIFLICVHIF